MIRVISYLVVLLGISLSLSCFEEKPDPLYDELVEKYNTQTVVEDLGPGDKIAIKVLHEEKLSGEFTVSLQGTISYPHVGRVNVQNKTCLNVEDMIAEGLRDGYLANPSVSCSIVEYNSKQIFVFGEVKTPGAFPYRANATIIDAIASAGGFSERARKNLTRLSRKVGDETLQVQVPVQSIIEGDKPPIKILPGDVIYVPVNPL